MRYEVAILMIEHFYKGNPLMCGLHLLYQRLSNFYHRHGKDIMLKGTPN